MPKILSLILVISCGSTPSTTGQRANTDSETTSEPAPPSSDGVSAEDERVSAEDERVSAEDERVSDGPVSAPEATEPRADARECAPTPWGGWEGTPSCRVAARRIVSGAHRRCEADEDCVLLRSGCVPHAVHQVHTTRYDPWEGPCVGPGEGTCDGPRTAICAGGCCMPAHPGLNVTSRSR